MGAERKSGDPDRALAGLAGRQHGVVARAQLIECGLGRRGIATRMEAGRLHVLHRGVYAVGHRAITRRGRWMAAVLAGGVGAALSHHAAAALWLLRALRLGATDVTIPRQRRSGADVRFHHVRLPADEITVLDGIPVTTMPRTLFDLAAVLDAREVERALNEADFLRLTDRLSLPDLLARHPRRAGAVNLRAALTARSAGATRTRSDMEELFIRVLDHSALPRPQTNVQVPGVGEVDCAWPEARLVLELDSRAAHATPAAFENDRERDRLLQTVGWRAVRVTWRQLTEDRVRLVADVRTLLAL
jgi:very-short-patch-repair endonuclease